MKQGLILFLIKKKSFFFSYTNIYGSDAKLSGVHGSLSSTSEGRQGRPGSRMCGCPLVGARREVGVINNQSTNCLQNIPASRLKNKLGLHLSHRGFPSFSSRVNEIDFKSSLCNRN